MERENSKKPSQTPLESKLISPTEQKLQTRNSKLNIQYLQFLLLALERYCYGSAEI